MGCPGLSTLWANGATSMYLWSGIENEVEVLRRLPAARSRIAAGVRSSLEFGRFLYSPMEAAIRDTLQQRYRRAGPRKPAG